MMVFKNVILVTRRIPKKTLLVPQNDGTMNYTLEEVLEQFSKRLDYVQGSIVELKLGQQVMQSSFESKLVALQTSFESKLVAAQNSFESKLVAAQNSLESKLVEVQNQQKEIEASFSSKIDQTTKELIDRIEKRGKIFRWC